MGLASGRGSLRRTARRSVWTPLRKRWRTAGSSGTETFAPNANLLGRAEGDGYVDLRSVSVYDTSPLTGGEWTPVDTASGPAFTSSGRFVAVAQEPTGRWLVVTTRSDERLALELLDAIAVDEQGDLAVDASLLGLDVIDRYDVTARGVEYTAGPPHRAAHSSRSKRQRPRRRCSRLANGFLPDATVD